jgi:hypothetical protein
VTKKCLQRSVLTHPPQSKCLQLPRPEPGRGQKVVTAFRVLTLGPGRTRKCLQRSGCLQRPTGRAAFRVLTTPGRPCSVPGAYNARPAVQRSGCLQRPTGHCSHRQAWLPWAPMLTRPWRLLSKHKACPHADRVACRLDDPVLDCLRHARAARPALLEQVRIARRSGHELVFEVGAVHATDLLALVQIHGHGLRASSSSSSSSSAACSSLSTSTSPSASPAAPSSES